MEDWIVIVVSLLPVVAKIINKVTPKWGDVSNKIVQVLLIIVEALDVLRKPKEYVKSLKKKTDFEKRIDEVLSSIHKGI